HQPIRTRTAAETPPRKTVPFMPFPPHPRMRGGQARGPARVVSGSDGLLAGPDRAGDVDHRDADRVAVFGPRAVIVAGVVAEDALEGEPGVAGALADAAIGDDRPGAVNADLGIDRP